MLKQHWGQSTPADPGSRSNINSNRVKAQSRSRWSRFGLLTTCLVFAAVAISLSPPKAEAQINSDDWNPSWRGCRQVIPPGERPPNDVNEGWFIGGSHTGPSPGTGYSYEGLQPGFWYYEESPGYFDIITFFDAKTLAEQRQLDKCNGLNQATISDWCKVHLFENPGQVFNANPQVVDCVNTVQGCELNRGNAGLPLRAVGVCTGLYSDDLEINGRPFKVDINSLTPDSIKRALANETIASPPPAPGPNQPNQSGTQTGNNQANPQDDCKFNLNWLFCGILEATSDGIEAMERTILSSLRVDPDQYCGQDADTENACSFRDAWRIIRNLSIFAFVGTALFVAIATALDFGVFANYTVKKYIGRLLVGAVAIVFSWAIGDLLIQVFNSAGDFVGGLILHPFSNHPTIADARDIGLHDIFGNWAGAALGGAGLYIGFLIASGSFALVPVLLIALLGFLMIFVGYLFLVMREFVLIALLIFSPIGIALWFLPGSDRAWRLYSKTFMSLLMIFPIIAAVLAFGRAFIWVLLVSDGGFGQDVAVMIMAFLVYVGMYAAIPFIFRRLLGVINRVTGSVNNPGRGAFDRLRNMRSDYSRRSAESRRGFRDRRDVESLRESERPSYAQRARQMIDEGVRQGRRLRRRVRSGHPITPMPYTSQYRDHVRTQERIDVAREWEGYIENAARDVRSQYTWDQHDEITQAALETPRTVNDRIHQEACLRVLSQRQDHNNMRLIHRVGSGQIPNPTTPDVPAATNESIMTAWQSVADTNYIFDQFREVAPDVARNQIGTINWSELPADMLGRIQAPTATEVQHWTQHMVAQLDQPETATVVRPQINQLRQSINTALTSPRLNQIMPPDTRAILQDIRNQIGAALPETANSPEQPNPVDDREA